MRNKKNSTEKLYHNGMVNHNVKFKRKQLKNVILIGQTLMEFKSE